MRLTLNWLKDFVDIDMNPEDLANLLTMVGLEVEELEPYGQNLDAVIVARLLSFEKHPEADRLMVCEVDTGKGQASVVCGAPNLEAGMLTAYAPPGVRLPNNIKVKKTKIRGMVSEGILLAEDEMGLTDDHTGILVFPPKIEPGTPVCEAMPLNDWAFEIGLTPNRPDCASVLGVAREIAAKTGKDLRRPELDLEDASDPRIQEYTSVTIEDPQGCPRYTAGLVRGVQLKPSPFWMRFRLHASGIRSINNVVDITNYVMLEVGQPLHAFDFHRLKENRIVVRRAGEGEKFETLDGQPRTLEGSDLMICDGQGSVALAGVMGGLNSEIYDETKDVLVESACFEPVTIRKTSKRLGLLTEASYRFERGVDVEGTEWALKRAMHLLRELANGCIEPGIIDNYPRPYEQRKIEIRVDKTNAFLGTSLGRDDMAGFFKALRMRVDEAGENVLRVSPPPCRVDLEREVDLMEEVARMEGYDRIPVTIPATRPEEEPDPPETALAEKVREIMVGFGFSQVITFSFIPPEFPDLLGAQENSRLRQAVGLLKPLTNEQAVMRTTLLHGVLQSAQLNIAHGERSLRLFEWGKVFFNDEHNELPEERLCLTALMTGAWHKTTIHRKGRTADFFDAKGVVEGVLESLGVRGFTFQKDMIPPGFSREAAARVLLGEKPVGHLGEIGREVSEAFELGPEKVFVFELDIPTLAEAIPEVLIYEPFARFPAVLRDLSVVVSAGTPSSSVQGIIAGERFVESVELFDLYQGDRIGASEKALTFRISYRSQDRTLDGQEINVVHEKIVKKIMDQLGGRLRDG